MANRSYILTTIKNTFEKYGYQPLETPGMENLSVLMGKYGDEGDQLLFKILNSGDFLKNVAPDDLEKGYKSALSKVAEKGLRYDLTVPFARYVAMNQHEIVFPFKRYQLQPVWRADRPQKGRYREFLQCDADVVGSTAPVCDAEVALMINEIFENLGIEDYSIRINHRKILSGIAELAGNPELENAFCVAIDKKDKIGTEKVVEELIHKGFEKNKVNQVMPILEMSGSNEAKIKKIRSLFETNSLDVSGIENIEQVLSVIQKLGKNISNIEIDLSLARGLSYYTGIIIEVLLNDGSIGSLSGGGRYDDLTGVFGVPGIPGVGFSLGFDRIYDVMVSRNLFDNIPKSTSKVLIAPFEAEAFSFALPLLQQMRDAGIASEIYPDIVKMKKQLRYANKKQIPFVLLIGSDEMATGQLVVKNMSTGDQNKINKDEIISFLINNI
jgi:histidyl-tRNA synthetase